MDAGAPDSRRGHRQPSGSGGGRAARGRRGADAFARSARRAERLAEPTTYRRSRRGRLTRPVNDRSESCLLASERRAHLVDVFSVVTDPLYEVLAYRSGDLLGGLP